MVAEKKSVDVLSVTKENAKKLAHVQIDALIDTMQDGEWGSLTSNITYGPGEAPVLHMSFLPGTSKENAVRIQQLFIEGGAEANKG